MSQIKINCGGKEFETYVETLERSSVLKMLLRRWNSDEPFLSMKIQKDLDMF